MKTNKILSDGVLAFILITAILLIDQVIKIEVKTHFSLGESVHITDWFYISFVENNGAQSFPSCSHHRYRMV